MKEANWPMKFISLLPLFLALDPPKHVWFEWLNQSDAVVNKIASVSMFTIKRAAKLAVEKSSDKSYSFPNKKRWLICMHDGFAGEKILTIQYRMQIDWRLTFQSPANRINASRVIAFKKLTNNNADDDDGEQSLVDMSDWLEPLKLTTREMAV